jgi:hypothetical protein
MVRNRHFARTFRRFYAISVPSPQTTQAFLGYFFAVETKIESLSVAAVAVPSQLTSKLPKGTTISAMAPHGALISDFSHIFQTLARCQMNIKAFP